MRPARRDGRVSRASRAVSSQASGQTPLLPTAAQRASVFPFPSSPQYYKVVAKIIETFYDARQQKAFLLLKNIRYFILLNSACNFGLPQTC